VRIIHFYEATPAKVREELARRLPDVEIQLPADDLATRTLLPQARVVLAERFTHDMLAAVEHLEWLQFPGSGPDHFFKLSGLTLVRRRGVRVLNSRDLRIPVAEQVMALALALVGVCHARPAGAAVAIFCADGCMARPWDHRLGRSVRVAELAKAFGMRVISTWHDWRYVLRQ
jgi:phosphoglycerate dehydrogenase-like enzyme